MKRAIWIAASTFLLGLSASAQSVVSVKVGLSLAGPTFYVDGQPYVTQQVFLWPVGSKHTLQFPVSVNAQGTELPYQSFNGDVARWTFGGWVDNLGLLTIGTYPNQTVTAFPGLSSIIGNVTVTYQVLMQFFNNIPDTLNGSCQGAPGNPVMDIQRYGMVTIDGLCFNGTTSLFLGGGVHAFSAFPYPGYVFVGWLVPGPQPPEYLFRYNITSAMTIWPNFQPAKRVIFTTNPTGLSLYVDHTLITTALSPPSSVLPGGNYDSTCTPDYTRLAPNAPLGYTPLCTGYFDFLPGSVHQIAAPVSQQDRQSKYWVFQGFSTGQGNNSNYTANNRLDIADVVTANFVPGVQTSVLTVPSGLPVSVDGRTNWPTFNFVWGEGETHTISAPAVVADSKGRKYKFIKWSDGGDPTHTISVPAGSQGTAVTATYQLLGQVQVTTNPPGFAVSVNGASCTTPCTFDQDPGTTLSLTAPAQLPVDSLTRFDFDNFTGGGVTNTQTVTFTTGVQLLQANYHASYAIVTASNPANSATFQFTPASPDGFFASGTQVQVTVTPNGGFKLNHWTGDLSGIFSSGYLTMSSPHSVTAVLDKVPYIPPAGIKNAAGDTPDGSVGPGSIISIYGENLAPALAIGPVNPLAQTIGGVTVTVNNRLLPLMFVSPNQINAQIFSDLPDGNYTLAVQRAGQPDVLGQFTVHRDAPGLFTQMNPDGTIILLALHADGTQVTPSSPATAGETITVYGTGFGPYDHQAVDGFIIPPSPTYLVADPVSVQAGGAPLQPAFAGAAAGFVGMTTLQVKLPDMPATPMIDFGVTVNGVASSTTKLPVVPSSTAN